MKFLKVWQVSLRRESRWCKLPEKSAYHAQRPVTLHLSRTSADNTQKCKSIQVLCMLCICKKKYHAQRPVTLHLVTPVILHAHGQKKIVVAKNAFPAVLEEVAIAIENLSIISCGATSAALRWPLTTGSLVEMLILEVESTWTTLLSKTKTSQSCGPTLSTTTTAGRMSST